MSRRDHFDAGHGREEYRAWPVDTEGPYRDEKGQPRKQDWWATDPDTGDIVGSLFVHRHLKKPNVWGFSGIEVEEPYRRKGVASALWNRVEQDLPDATFTHTSVTSDEGWALAKALHRRNPERHGPPSRNLLASGRDYDIE